MQTEGSLHALQGFGLSSAGNFADSLQSTGSRVLILNFSKGITMSQSEHFFFLCEGLTGSGSSISFGLSSNSGGLGFSDSGGLGFGGSGGLGFGGSGGLGFGDSGGLGFSDSGGLGFSDSGGLGLGDSGSIRSSFRGARSFLLAEGKERPVATNIKELTIRTIQNDTVIIDPPVIFRVTSVPVCVGERTSADPFPVGFFPFRNVTKTNPGRSRPVLPSHLHGCCLIGSIQDGGEVSTLLLAFNLTGSLGDVLLNQEVIGSVRR